MHAARRTIHVRETTGSYTRVRWAMVWLTQVVFFGLPWLRWNDRPLLRIDLPAQVLYFLDFAFGPPDWLDLGLTLALGGLSVILSCVIVARAWCGFACPHSVYTEIFRWIECRLEGGRSARMRLEQSPMSLSKFRAKAFKHLAWILVSCWTGLTFVAYFVPIDELLQGLFSGSLGSWELIGIGAYGMLAYVNAGWVRERFCRTVCPYPQVQRVFFGPDTLRVSYDAVRGEPRGLRNPKSLMRNLPLGDCVDCTLCLQVCPTGSDIRQGWPQDCMGCAACIDACNLVMDKIGAPRGLIRYARVEGLPQQSSTNVTEPCFIRARVVFYFSAVVALILTVLASLDLRGGLP